MKIVRIEYDLGEFICDVSKILYIRTAKFRGGAESYYISFYNEEDEFFFKDKDQYEEALKVWKENASE